MGRAVMEIEQNGGQNDLDSEGIPQTNHCLYDMNKLSEKDKSN